MTDENVPPEDRELFAALAAIPRPLPPEVMAGEFGALARADVAARRPARLWLVAALAAMLFLAIGGAWWADRASERREIAKLHAELAQLPVTLRFQRISEAGDSVAASNAIVGALTAALLTDSNTNVRVAAATALGRIASRSALADAAEQSIRSDSSPFVQLALLHATTRLSSRERSALLHLLLARPGLDPAVRAEVVARNRS